MGSALTGRVCGLNKNKVKNAIDTGVETEVNVKTVSAAHGAKGFRKKAGRANGATETDTLCSSLINWDRPSPPTGLWFFFCHSEPSGGFFVRRFPNIFRGATAIR